MLRLVCVMFRARISMLLFHRDYNAYNSIEKICSIDISLFCL